MPTATATNGKLSVQPRFDARQMTDASAYLWTFFDRFTSENTIPEWGNPSRVDKLREFARQEPILVGALSSMTSKAVSLDWQITGGRNRVTRYQEILAEADAGAGWSFFLDRLLQDYWQADQGGFVELGRHGKNGPVLGVYNLDAGTVQLLTSPKTPAAYYPRLITGAVSGKRIPLEPSDFTRIVDMPTPDESKAGLGFCATSRALKVAQVLMALYNYEEERLSDMPLPGIAAITGMTQSEVRSAFELYKAHREDKQQTTFKGVLWLAAQSSPINPIGVNLTSFSSLPEGFDKKTTIELYVYTLALDFGVDVREFWPASQTGATKAEAEVQAQKAKGKGFGRALTSVERMVNWDILPEGLEFVFDQKDSEDDLLRETIREKVIANIATLAGGQLISPDEARRWLVELEMAPEWLAETNMTTVHGNANTDEEAPEVVEREEPPPAAEQATPPAVDQAVAEKARRARLEPGEDFVAINGAGDVVTLWSSRRVFAFGEKKFNPDQPRVPAGERAGGQWASTAATLSDQPTRDEFVNARLWEKRGVYTGDTPVVTSLAQLPAVAAGHVRIAHGTRPENVRSILRDGLRPGQDVGMGERLGMVLGVHGEASSFGEVSVVYDVPAADAHFVNDSWVEVYRPILPAEIRGILLGRMSTTDVPLLAGAYEEWNRRFGVEKRFDPGQPRWPEGDPRGGQWRPEGGAAQAGAGQEAPAEPTPAKQARQARPNLPTQQADELIASLRQATAALLEAEKAFDPDQPRWPAGDERGGQWRPEGGGTTAAANAQLDITTGDINAMRAEMGLPPETPGQQAGRRNRTSTSRKIKNLGGGINESILLEDENGTRWVWKPVEGSQDGNSEVAAYEIAQVLGMDCVPPTRYEEFDGVLGTAQQFVDGTLSTEWVAQNGNFSTPLEILGPKGIEDVVVLDAIVGNTDRHTANWIVGEKLWAIDNGGATWLQGNGNEFPEIYFNTLVNGSYYRKPGKLRISPEKREQWSSITKEEFLGAFRDVPEYGETRVNPEIAWSNFQSITKSGVLAWRGWNDPSPLSLPAVSEAPAAPPVDDDTEEALRQAQRAPWPLFREWSY